MSAKTTNALKREVGNLEKEQGRIIAYISQKKSELKEVEKDVSARETFLKGVDDSVRKSEKRYVEVEAGLVVLTREALEKKEEIKESSDEVRRLNEKYIRESRDLNARLQKDRTSAEAELRLIGGKVSAGESAVERLNRRVISDKEMLVQLEKDYKGALKKSTAREKLLRQLASSIESLHLELKDLDLQVADRKKQAEKGVGEIKKIESETIVVLKKNEKEKVALDKLTKKRIAAGEKAQILTQVEEEIRAAYERAGMQYPYEK